MERASGTDHCGPKISTVIRSDCSAKQRECLSSSTSEIRDLCSSIIMRKCNSNHTDGFCNRIMQKWNLDHLLRRTSHLKIECMMVMDLGKE